MPQLYDRKQAALDLAETLDEDPPEELSGFVSSLRQRLDDAVKSKGRSEEAEENLAELQKDLVGKQKVIEEKTKELAEFEATLSAISPEDGDPETGIRRLKEVRKWTNDADLLERKLMGERPDWREKHAEALGLEEEGVTLELSTEEQVNLKAETEEIDGALSELREKIGRLRQEEEQLLHEPGVDYVDGAIETLEEEQTRIRRERDRLYFLASIINEADARYREEHQPEVLRDASKYIRVITGGKYKQLAFEETDGSSGLVLKAAGSPHPKSVGHPLSRGLREQVYLSLRLALVDHVDGDERLPLVLDEFFVNWDPGRTARGLEVLRELGEKRQIIVLTCHPDFAERLADEAGAQVVTIPSPI